MRVHVVLDLLMQFRLWPFSDLPKNGQDHHRDEDAIEEYTGHIFLVANQKSPISLENLQKLDAEVSSTVFGKLLKVRVDSCVALLAVGHSLNDVRLLMAQICNDHFGMRQI